MRIGESRPKALQKMVERVDIPEFSSFVRAVIQADQLGISLGRILRVQAQDTRKRRQLAAEEKAMKAPIKMLFPTVLFIFPALFIVILGPAFMNIARDLLGLSRDELLEAQRGLREERLASREAQLAEPRNKWVGWSAYSQIRRGSPTGCGCASPGVPSSLSWLASARASYRSP